jgi:hypothetical protein
MNAIERLYNIAHHNIGTINGTMDYNRITDTLITLANVICDSETDESTWWIGEGGYFSLSDLIAGAYWHYTEWHGGQSSKGYAALSALGQVFHPGMEVPDDENIAYELLNKLAESDNKL